MSRTDSYKHIVLVEGQTDKKIFLPFFQAELKQKSKQIGIRIPEETLDLKTKKPLRVRGIGGVIHSLNILLQLRSSGQKSLFAIVDADEDYENRFKQFKDAFTLAGFDVAEPNKVYKQNGLSVGVFIIGENKPDPTFKDLETLLFTIRTHQTEVQYQTPLDAFQTFCQTYKVSHPDKSAMSIYLAHLPEFCNHDFGKGLDLGYFNPKSPELAFLNNLLTHIRLEDTTNLSAP
jgi:hypothetical protein